MIISLVVKVHYGGCNRQPLAECKGVHREVESERSRRQSPAPRNTNPIKHTRWDKARIQAKVQRLHGQRGVNRAERWDESYLSYHGRSHGRNQYGQQFP